MKCIFTHLLIVLTFAAAGQAKLVINGGIININNGAVLIIDNPDNTAITQTGSGYIISEGENNRIIWSIGAGNAAAYLLPFGNISVYLPVSFSAASGSVNGQMVFSTYPTPSWKNSDYLPTGVANVNSSGADNSAKLIDRFWQIKSLGYSAKPTLSNLRFTYSDAEYNSPNTIAEVNLVPQRWNNLLLSWSDYLPGSTINTTANTITIASVPGNQLYDWWTMVDASAALPVTLINFKAIPVNQKIVASWQTAFENNTSHFELWRSKGVLSFDSVGKLTAAGNSTGLLNYSFIDNNPYDGVSYYRLKTVDKDGRFEWSAIVKVIIDDKHPVSLYPNPASDNITISVNSSILDKKPMAFIYDARGALSRSFKITERNQQVHIGFLAAGIYLLKLSTGDEIQTITFIKD